jgi:hypothetical protein
MPDLSPWMKVVTQPLGFAAFALFIVFLVLSRTTRAVERRWLAPSLLALAIISLVGGLAIAWMKNQSPNISAQTNAPNSIAVGVNKGTVINQGTVNMAPMSAGGESTTKQITPKAGDAKK